MNYTGRQAGQAFSTAPVAESEIARERDRLREGVERLGVIAADLDQRLRMGGIVLQRPVAEVGENLKEQETYSDLGNSLSAICSGLRSHTDRLSALLQSLAV